MVNVDTYIFISDFDPQDKFLLEIGTPVVCNIVPVSLKTKIFCSKMQSTVLLTKSFPEFLVIHEIYLLMAIRRQQALQSPVKQGDLSLDSVAKLLDIFVSRRKIRKDVQSCIYSFFSKSTL